MLNKRPYKGPAIEVYGHRRLLLSWLREPFVVFSAIWGSKIAGMAGDLI